MIQSIQRESIFETLLNSLEAERYVRGPLLRTLVDELAASAGFEHAADAARLMLEGLPEAADDFGTRVAELRKLIQTLAGAPAVAAARRDPFSAAAASAA